MNEKRTKMGFCTWLYVSSSWVIFIKSFISSLYWLHSSRKCSSSSIKPKLQHGIRNSQGTLLHAGPISFACFYSQRMRTNPRPSYNLPTRYVFNSMQVVLNIFGWHYFFFNVIPYSRSRRANTFMVCYRNIQLIVRYWSKFRPTSIPYKLEHFFHVRWC